jgi:pyrimidine operon attenuation protein/uracil phosphoribosyltransferase
MTVTQKMRVLDEAQIDQKIKRIAYQIFENNFEEKTIFIAGIQGPGYVLGKKIKNQLEKISNINVELMQIEIDKMSPSQSDIKIDGDLSEVKNKVVLLVDDVQHTGKTFAYSLRPFLNIKVKKIEVAVLVNRAHTSFPVAPTYTGYELSTTINDHIHVVLDDGKKGVYLQ